MFPSIHQSLPCSESQEHKQNTFSKKLTAVKQPHEDVQLPLLKKKLFLNLTPTHKEPQFEDMRNQRIMYVHASNSSSFSGLTKFRALLSMEQIDSTGWFHKDGLKSGERGYTIERLYKNQPISQGVSLNHIQDYQESLNLYSKSDKKESHYPVLYGFGSDIIFNQKIQEHPISDGAITIDQIKAIYVPSEHLQDAKDALRCIEKLTTLVRPLIENNEPFGRVSCRKRFCGQ